MEKTKDFRSEESARKSFFCMGLIGVYVSALAQKMRKLKMRIKKRDLTGCRFGKLVVLHAVSEVKEGYGASVWRCRCDCSKEVNVMYFGLVSGNNKSCGCLKEESQKNLRERMELVDGTCVEWLKDRKIRTDNKSGCKGVYKRKSGKYSVTIGFKKRIIYLGSQKEGGRGCIRQLSGRLQHLEEKGRTGSRMGEGTSFPV